MSYNIGFIGGGNMSTAIFKGILKNDQYSASQIFVSGPHLNNLKHWQDFGANITTKNGDVLGKCQYVFLGVKPAMMEKSIDEAISSLPQNISSDNILIISMLAGVTLEKLKLKINSINIPNSVINVARIMPNVSMAVGSGACLYSCDERVPDYQKQELRNILQSCGDCEEVAEPLMNNLGVLTACGPAYMFIVIEALADGAVKQGVPRDLALRFAAQMVKGSAHLVIESKKHPGQLKDEVCSPGGSTICGISVLESGKVRSTFIDAIEASVNKTNRMETTSKRS